MRYGYEDDREHGGHAEQTAASGTLRQVEPLRLLVRAGDLEGLSEMARQLPRHDRLAGIDQVQQRKVALENLLEEERGLEANIGANLGVGGPGGKELRIGRLIGTRVGECGATGRRSF